MNTGWDSEAFDDVLIAWRCRARGLACQARMSWLGSVFLEVTLEQELVVPFSVDTEDGNKAVFGQLVFHAGSSDGDARLLLDLTYPGGEVANYELWPQTDAPSPPPPPPVHEKEPSEEIAATIEGKGGADLFPYVYLRPWPKVSETDLELRFVQYQNPCGPSWTADLYCQLVEDREDRSAMEAEALRFLDGDFPYQDQFLGSIENLEGPIAKFSAFDRWVKEQPGIGVDCFRAELERVLGMPWVEIAAYVLLDPAFRAQLDRCWQNLFALVVILGYDGSLLDDVIQTLVMASLVTRMVESSDDEWSADQIRQGSTATVVLPSAVFPLPPAPPTASTETPPGMALLPGAAPRAIQPYAIGDLQLVRQRLLRYELGEVSHIENVLQGEAKETTRRNLNRRSESATEHRGDALEAVNDLEGIRADLLTETQRTLSVDLKVDQSTNYGPPQEGTAEGSLVIEPTATGTPQREDVEAAAGFARNVTAKTANRIAREARSLRSVATLDEAEETVVSRLDARACEGNVTGIYRWVNKVYQAWVVHYGERLIIEFLVEDPARAYISSEQSLTGTSLTEPRSPSSLGVHTFRDISRDPGAPGYYAALAARYAARSITPPPPERQVAGATFQSGTDVFVQQLRVPEGYVAEQASVTVNWGDNTGMAQVYGIVGKQPFAFDAARPDENSKRYPMNLERSVIPVALAARDSSYATATGSTAAATRANHYVATVEVEGTLGVEMLDRWKIETYDAITAAYQRKKEAYFQAAGARPQGAGARDPLAHRETIRRQLKEGVARQLLRHAAGLTGEVATIKVGQPRYVQLFEQAFEWDEMSYSFTVRTGETPTLFAINQYQGENEPFAAFLEAGLARILLPVNPRYSFIIPYFLASGMIWDRLNSLAPANRQSVSLINDLKNAEPLVEAAKATSKPWEIKVPTGMVMLQASRQLPGRKEGMVR